MVKYVIVDDMKGKPIATASESMTRGAFLDNGDFIADKERDYNGVNAVIDKKEKEFETIASGDLYVRIPTRIGEEYATTELTGGSGMTAGDKLVVSSKKLVDAGANTPTWEFVGEYANPFGLTMYQVRRIG